MKILITGAGGQLGREWTETLMHSEHKAFALGSGDLDITDARVVENIFEELHPDLIVNCAAYTAVDDAEENREKAFLVNETGPAILAEACSRHKAKLVHYSTDYVFEGKETDRKQYPEGYPEGHQPNPQNVYGESKLAGEKAVETGCDDWLIIRVSWLCGRFGNNFVKTMLRLSAEKDQLKVVNDQTGSPSYCRDVVEKTMVLAESGQKGYFHISSKGMVSWYEFSEEIFRQMNSKIPVEPVSSSEFKTKAKRPAMSYLNTGKIEALNLEPIRWEKGLRKLLHQLKRYDYEN